MRRLSTWTAVLAALVSLLTLTAAASGRNAAQHGRAAVKDTSLPTWRDVYDWTGGNGYVGWHAATSSDGDYGAEAALGGRYGLWLWPRGGQHAYTPGDFAEWTYTASGTTRIEHVSLSFAYRNKLLAHHCIDVGLRDGSGAVVDQEEHCKPVEPPATQDRVDVTLSDPAANPTAKVLYVRIRVDCGGEATCARTLPSLDPLATGGYVRTLGVDMTLVDDDDPVPAPAGQLWDLRDQYVNGNGAFGLTVAASDAGSGIERAWAEHGGDVLASQEAPCDPAHNTPALDARICPQSFSFDTSVDVSAFPEGTNTLAEKASDVAGNVGSRAWKIYVDRTAPSVPGGIDLLVYDPVTQTAAVGWNESSDPALPDGVPGSGLRDYQFRWRTSGGDWSGWSDAAGPNGSISHVAEGAVIDVEVRSVDGVGNASQAGSATIDLAQELEPGLGAPADIPDYSGQPTLDSASQAQAVSVALASTRARALIGGQPFTVGTPQVWTDASGAVAGANIHVDFDSTLPSLTGDWPSVSYDQAEPDLPYETYSAHFTATDVPGLDLLVDLRCNRVMAITPSYPADVDPDQTVVGPSSPAPACATAAPQRSRVGTPVGWIKNVRVISEGPDAFYNFDFHHATEPVAENADGPVNLIFWGNALAPQDTQLYTFGSGASQYVGTAENGFVNQGHGWEWDDHHGYKSRLTCGTDNHYRVYHDDAHTPEFNPYWGYFFIGTAHEDRGDIPAVKVHGITLIPSPCSSSQYGWYEQAEQHVADEAARVFGTIAVQRNKVFLNNVLTPHWDRDHYEVNNGRATKIKVCLDAFGKQKTCTSGSLS